MTQTREAPARLAPPELRKRRFLILTSAFAEVARSDGAEVQSFLPDDEAIRVGGTTLSERR